MVVLLTVNLGDAESGGSDGIFFAGEKFVCTLTFSNVAVHETTSAFSQVKRPPDIPPIPGDARRQRTHPSLLNTSQYSSTIDLDTETSVGQAEVDFGSFDVPAQEGQPARATGTETASRNGAPLRLSTAVSPTSSEGPRSAHVVTTESTGSLTQLLRKSISLSSLRSAVGSTLGMISNAASSATGNTAVQHDDSQAVRHIQPKEMPRALRTYGAPRSHLTVDLGPSSPPISPFPVSPMTTKPVNLHTTDNRISLHTINEDQPAHQRPRGPSVSSNASQGTTDFTSASVRKLSPKESPEYWHSARGSAPSEFGSHPEQITWAYAQMTGHFSIDPNFVKPAAFASLKSAVMYRAAGVPGSGMGGGGSLALATGAQGDNSETKNLPLYSTPPSILFTNLSLGPGENQSYKYEITLPTSLPPSHRGKAVRFSYKLIIGVQRGGIAHRSQVIQLPFRVFSHVRGDGTYPVYELSNPVIIKKDEATVKLETSPHMGIQTLLDHAVPGPRQPVARSLQDPDENPTSFTRLVAVCQSTKRSSYDICKNNEHVAQLVLQRNAYRLGESITGIVDFSNSKIACFQMSVFLENMEHIEESVAMRTSDQSSRLTRRVYAEQHRCTLNTKRTNIDLFLPINCSPEFQTSAVSLRWCLRVEFVTGTNSRLHYRANKDKHFAHSHAVPAAKVEAFDCVIPLRIYGTRTARTTQSVQLYEIP
ncbi:Rgp1-domain-containing protein [Gaertneriomyces semiglobifer]|nr:Rgp1-domain-containing protein [Gaertneriomyces semiglobifer]